MHSISIRISILVPIHPIHSILIHLIRNFEFESTAAHCRAAFIHRKINSADSRQVQESTSRQWHMGCFDETVVMGDN